MRALVCGCVAALVGGGATRALAYPFLPMRPVPDAIAGPTDPHVAATLYNPAAIGYLRGIHFFVDGGARTQLGSVARDGGAGSSSVAWINPDTFVGVTWDLGTETLNLGISVYTPFSEFSSYPKRGPLRFHEQHLTFATLEETLAGAWQIEKHVAVGAALIIHQSWIDWAYARDLAPAGGSARVVDANSLCGGAPCGYENALAEQQIGLRGFDYGFGFAVGLIVRPDDRVWIGISYTSHEGGGGDINLANSRQSRVTTAPGQGMPCRDADGNPTPNCFGDDRIILLLPEMVQAGVRVQATPRLDIEASWRFVHWGARSAVDVSLQGGNLGLADVAPQYFLDRGLQNSYLVEVSTRHTVSPALRLSPSLAFETSAITPSAVNPAALDAPKLDGALTVEWKPWRSGNNAFIVGAHLGATVYFVGHVQSRFDAGAETACVDSAYALDVCQKQNLGQALPSASGNYTLFTLNAGLALGFIYQP
jgi:long-subunit fatty acid transport protein